MLSQAARRWTRGLTGAGIQVRSLYKVGDKIPISFMTGKIDFITNAFILFNVRTDTPDPVIKEDSEYPDWVHTLDQKVYAL